MTQPSPGHGTVSFSPILHDELKGRAPLRQDSRVPRLSPTQGMCARLFAAGPGVRFNCVEPDSGLVFLFEHDLRANASRLSRGKNRFPPFRINALIESALMTQAHHFLDEDRFLLVVEACE